MHVIYIGTTLVLFLSGWSRKNELENSEITAGQHYFFPLYVLEAKAISQLTSSLYRGVALSIWIRHQQYDTLAAKHLWKVIGESGVKWYGLEEPIRIINATAERTAIKIWKESKDEY